MGRITVELTRAAREALYQIAAIELPDDAPQLDKCEQAIDVLDGFLTLAEQSVSTDAAGLVPVRQIGRRMFARTFARDGTKVPDKS